MAINKNRKTPMKLFALILSYSMIFSQSVLVTQIFQLLPVQASSTCTSGGSSGYYLSYSDYCLKNNATAQTQTPSLGQAQANYQNYDPSYAAETKSDPQLNTFDAMCYRSDISTSIGGGLVSRSPVVQNTSTITITNNSSTAVETFDFSFNYDTQQLTDPLSVTPSIGSFYGSVSSSGQYIGHITAPSPDGLALGQSMTVTVVSPIVAGYTGSITPTFTVDSTYSFSHSPVLSASDFSTNISNNSSTINQSVVTITNNSSSNANYIDFYLYYDQSQLNAPNKVTPSVGSMNYNYPFYGSYFGEVGNTNLAPGDSLTLTFYQTVQSGYSGTVTPPTFSINAGYTQYYNYINPSDFSTNLSSTSQNAYTSNITITNNTIHPVSNITFDFLYDTTQLSDPLSIVPSQGYASGSVVSSGDYSGTISSINLEYGQSITVSVTGLIAPTSTGTISPTFSLVSASTSYHKDSVDPSSFSTNILNNSTSKTQASSYSFNSNIVNNSTRTMSEISVQYSFDSSELYNPTTIIPTQGYVYNSSSFSSGSSTIYTFTIRGLSVVPTSNFEIKIDSLIVSGNSISTTPTLTTTSSIGSVTVLDDGSSWSFDNSTDITPHFYKIGDELYLFRRAIIYSSLSNINYPSDPYYPNIRSFRLNYKYDQNKLDDPTSTEISIGPGTEVSSALYMALGEPIYSGVNTGRVYSNTTTGNTFGQYNPQFGAIIRSKISHPVSKDVNSSDITPPVLSVDNVVIDQYDYINTSDIGISNSFNNKVVSQSKVVGASARITNNGPSHLTDVTFSIEYDPNKLSSPLNGSILTGDTVFTITPSKGTLGTKPQYSKKGSNMVYTNTLSEFDSAPDGIVLLNFSLNKEYTASGDFTVGFSAMPTGPTDPVYECAVKDLDLTNNRSSFTAVDNSTIPTGTNADLSIVKTSSGGSNSSTNTQGKFTKNSTASYTLTATNNGPDTAGQPITIVDTLPSNVTYSSYSGTNWTCSTSGTSTVIVTCVNLNDLTNGSSSQVIISVNVS